MPLTSRLLQIGTLRVRPLSRAPSSILHVAVENEANRPCHERFEFHCTTDTELPGGDATRNRQPSTV